MFVNLGRTVRPFTPEWSATVIRLWWSVLKCRWYGTFWKDWKKTLKSNVIRINMNVINCMRHMEFRCSMPAVGKYTRTSPKSKDNFNIFLILSLNLAYMGAALCCVRTLVDGQRFNGHQGRTVQVSKFLFVFSPFLLLLTVISQLGKIKSSSSLDES